MKQIDISNELHLYKYKTGIKLVNPVNNTYSLGKDTGYTMGDLFKLPFNIGMCTADHNIQYVNLEAAISMGSESENSHYSRKTNCLSRYAWKNGQTYF